MSDVKISQLPASTTPLAGTELVPIVQSGVTKQATVNQFGAGVGYLSAGTAAVATTVQAKLRESVSVFDFMTAAQIADVQAGTKLLTVTTELQAAADYAWKNGKILFVPAGTYKGKLTLPPSGTTEPRGDAFIMQGEGAGSTYLGGAPYIKGTTIVSPDTLPAFNLTNVLTTADSGPQIHIRDIRFEGTSSTNAVVQFATWNDFCEMRNCEVRQDGTGGGINMIRAYGGTIKETHIVNNNLIGTGSYTGTGVNVGTPYSGALLTFQKVSVRGFNTGFALGSGGNFILNTTLQQCECAWNNYGIIIAAGMRKTVINECYFEEVQTVGIQDEGEGTTISNCMMFEGCATQIKNDYDTRGNLYFGNYIQLGGPNETGIKVKSSGDALGYKKTIRDNFIYFLNNGGTVAGVVGIQLTGSNPVISVVDNMFRPRRSWVGGSGTIKFLNSSTGTITGTIPVTNILDEFSHQVGLQYSLAVSSAQITQADVVGGVLTIPDTGSLFNVNMSVATNVTSIDIGNGIPRVVYFYCYNGNPTFVKGTRIEAPSNYTPSALGGMLCVNFRIVGGVAYSSEISRSVYA